MKKTKLIYLFLVFAFFTACKGKTTETPLKQQTATEEVKEEQVVEGGDLNSFFPKEQAGFSIVFTQEKDGFAQADLKKDGQAVATLAVSDVANNSSAVAKFAKSKDKLAGYPLTKSGGKGTVILVADKYQVQVRSISSDFTEAMRKEWIEKFNLSGLSKLKK